MPNRPMLVCCIMSAVRVHFALLSISVCIRSGVSHSSSLVFLFITSATPQTSFLPWLMAWTIFYLANLSTQLAVFSIYFAAILFNFIKPVHYLVQHMKNLTYLAIFPIQIVRSSIYALIAIVYLLFSPFLFLKLQLCYISFHFLSLSSSVFLASHTLCNFHYIIRNASSLCLGLSVPNTHFLFFTS